MAKEFYPTPHLIENLEKRNVTWSEIVDILDKPDVSYGPDVRGRMVHQKGDLSVVVARDNSVITVLLRSAETWSNEDARKR